MKKKSSSFITGRRQFLKNILPTGTFFCFGCSGLLAAAKKDKFLEDSGMSFQDVFAFTFLNYYIPIMKKMAEEQGKDLFLETLKKAAAAAAVENMKNMAKSFPKRDLAMMAIFTKTNPLFQRAMSFEFVEETKNAFEIKVSRCLWAETFHRANAAEIGYASICYPDYPMTTAFNPKIKMIRTKTLMQGHDCCNHRYVMEG
jgi:hypothetical protein